MDQYSHAYTRMSMPIVSHHLHMAAKRQGAKPEEVGRRIRAARLAVPYTQEELAAAANLTQPTISAIERGETQNPEADTILKLAIALRCTPFYLMWDHDLPSSAGQTHAAMIDLWQTLDAGQQAQVLAYAQGLADAARKAHKPQPSDPPKPITHKPTQSSRRGH